MIRKLAALAALLAFVLTPTTPGAEPPVDVRTALTKAIDAYESGDNHQALLHIRHAREAIVAESSDIPAGVLPNLRELEQALAAYRLYAYGRRPDFDAAHDAVLRVIDELRIGYRERNRPFTRRTRRVNFDIDGRIRRIGDLEIRYVPFTDRLRKVGTIDIRYVPFSEHPREIGPIDFWWVFGELREVADVDVDRHK